MVWWCNYRSKPGQGKQSKMGKILKWFLLLLDYHLLKPQGFLERTPPPPPSQKNKQKKPQHTHTHPNENAINYRHWLVSDMTYYLHAPPIPVITASCFICTRHADTLELSVGRRTWTHALIRCLISFLIALWLCFKWFNRTSTCWRCFLTFYFSLSFPKKNVLFQAPVSEMQTLSCSDQTVTPHQVTLLSNGHV